MARLCFTTGASPCTEKRITQRPKPGVAAILSITSSGIESSPEYHCLRSPKALAAHTALMIIGWFEIVPSIISGRSTSRKVP